ncbi:hypothetical protein KDK95_11635 [Actinospica sp. MGRD01-02]|uniref:Uncharacterized protein n=1 Tax=Actinospica acidithermotolerans TaxID=2828514 RepID=A0A941EAQ0_9ACTN|nr:hypothetical protein [Actinospica acidithermotolerans]MBR7826957.1 hypothetical protein [Actinospica acidithermotolerans]
MADLVISYSLLYECSTQLKNLETQFANTSIWDSGIPTQSGTVDDSVFGDAGLGASVDNLFSQWAAPFGEAKSRMDQLSTAFAQLAHAWFDVDAQAASQVTAGEVMSAAKNYPAEWAAYEAALQQYNQNLADLKKNGESTTTYTQYVPDGHGGWIAETVPMPGPPTPPGATSTTPASGSYGPGTTTVTQNPDGSIASETTTVTGPDGLTYSETTTFGPSQGTDPSGNPIQDTTSVVHNSDGSSDTITVTENPNGNATMTDVNSDGTTTDYSRTGWNGTWVDTTPAKNPDNSPATQNPRGTGGHSPYLD